MRHYPRLSLDAIHTLSVYDRTNLVTTANMARPGTEEEPLWTSEAMQQLVAAIVAARREDRPVIWSMGAHVIKNGLARYVISLVERGWVTHVAGNGAASIHDFELAYLGGTSEDVATAIEDGTFGMWEETGRWMNQALNEAADGGQGYGAGLASYIARHPDRFPYAEDCVIARVIQAGRPYTSHISLGTDIIHQHPSADFGALAYCSAVDFESFCRTVSQLDGGVILNFGSAVSGPLLFLRALSVAYNRGQRVCPRAAANFDLQPEVGVRGVGPEQILPRTRTDFLDPVERLGGSSWNFTLPHDVSIPSLFRHLLEVEEGGA